MATPIEDSGVPPRWSLNVQTGQVELAPGSEEQPGFYYCHAHNAVEAIDSFNQTIDF
jgi:hypothetical protein